MNTLMIVGIILLILVIWILYPDKTKKIYQEYALVNNWEYRRTDKDYVIYELLKSYLFYKVKDFKSRLIRKPYSAYNILKRGDEIVCTASFNGRTSVFFPDYLIYLNVIELPKLFIVSKTSSIMNTIDINYYKDEFDEIDADLSTDTHIIIVNSYEKDVLSPKVKKIMEYFSEKYHLMIRNNKLVVHTTKRKIEFQEFIVDCQRIVEDLSKKEVVF